MTLSVVPTPSEADYSRHIAELLLEIEAVKINVAEPFTLTSGKKSPVYVNCRKIIGNVEARGAVVRGIARKAEAYKPEVIAGGETAGIPLAAFVAQKLELPMVYVRKAKKGFGTNELVEGGVELKGKKVLLVEDHITDGGSVLSFKKSLEAQGSKVGIITSVFSYGEYGKMPANLQKPLVSWADILPIAQAKFSAKEIEAVKTYLQNRLKQIS